MGFSGQISVIMLAGAVAGVIKIQTSGVIWVGKLMLDDFLIWIEHFKVMVVVLFSYRVAMHDGGLESGW